jgi:hypothetical protein
MRLKEVGFGGLRGTRLLSLGVKGEGSEKEPHFFKIVKSCCVLALERNFSRFFSI